MYNEKWQEFDDTMRGILINVKQMKETYLEAEGVDIIDEIVVFLIADGFDRLRGDFYD